MESLADEPTNINVPIKSPGVCRRLIERALSCAAVSALGAFYPSCSTSLNVWFLPKTMQALYD
jgi:hypothetical protein